MSKFTTGKFKRILKSYVIPLSACGAILYGVAKLVGTPTDNYRRIEFAKTDKSEMDYFDKEVSTMIQEVCVEGKSGVSFWHDYARDRGEAEKLTRKRIQELIKEGRGTEADVVSELRKIDNTKIQDNIDMVHKPKIKPEDLL